MEEKDEYEHEKYDGKKNIAIILIDVGPSMFENKDKAFKRCMGASFKVMEKILLRTYRKNICICLMKDEEIAFTKFADNLVNSSKKLLEICRTKNEDLIPKFQRSQPVSLRHTLTECLKLLPSKLYTVNPYVIVLTNDDDPHRGDQKENLGAFNIATSFRDMNTRLVVLPLKDNFNSSLFYTELMKNANAIPLEVFEDGAEEESYLQLEVMTEMLDSIICDTMVTHRQKFEFYETKTDDTTFTGRISVQMSYYARKSHLYKNITKSRTTGAILKKMSKTGDSSELKLTDMKGSNDITFDKIDQNIMRLQMPYGFRLLYITPNKQSSIHHQKRMSFILQNDEMCTYKHQVWFEHMWQYCRDKNRYVIAGYNMPGSKQSPKIVELTPIVQRNKPAFSGHFLINCDEINRFPASITNNWISSKSEKPKPTSSDEPTLKAVCDVIDQLTIKYEPREWKDPKYEQKAVFIRAQLLDMKPDPFLSSIPTKQEVDERLGSTMHKLKMICPEFFPNRDGQPPMKKPRTAGRGRGK